ncbi:amino acid adenylation domain-containing protein [Symbioplanes lichenis]|uniref:amino acid adenylation domain-containing protein n=1 Tax=Symbioplanes lichenis TaxID=1629072 RepID=UPI002738FF46|nr:amino acid adenylation domain-containing protein [Actinoplanes lichenis]
MTRSQHCHEVAESACESLVALADRTGVSPAALLVQAFGDVLSLWSSRPRFVVSYRDLTDPGSRPQPLVIDSDVRSPFLSRSRDLDRRMHQGDGHSRASAEPAVPDVLITWRTGNADENSAEREYPACDADAGHESGTDTRPGLECALDAGVSGLTVLLTSREGLFIPRLAEDVLASLRDVLTQLVEHSEARARLPQRQEYARRQVNDTCKEVPGGLLHHRFWEVARRVPERSAVIAQGRSVSYGQLQAASSALADRLQGLDAAPNTLVAIVLGKGWKQAVATIGILESGAAYVPVDPDLPPARFHHLLRHAAVSIAVTDQDSAAGLEWPDGIEVVVLDEGLPTEPARAAPRHVQDVSDLAYVIYTSGSTGEPKGVMIDHRGATGTVSDVNDRFRVSADDRVLAMTPLSFDLSVYDLFGPLSVGGTLVMPDPGADKAPWHWADLIREHRVTLWNSVPAMMEMLTGYTLALRGRLPESLRLLLLSGDWIPVTLPKRIRALASQDLQIVSLGGATEASIWSVFHPIGDVDETLPSIPYGKPLTNQWFDVLDCHLRQRPEWVAGDLYVGGSGVALGYWRDEEKTQAAFIVHPHTGQRMYRLGDLARYLPDGNLEFLGRNDFQVKINGFRVELGEIEATLLAHPHVTAAVTVAHGDPQNGKRLVAYVVAAAGGLVQDIRAFLTGKLPAHMVPADVILLDALPLTRNGKVDRQALPPPSRSRQR